MKYIKQFWNIIPLSIQFILKLHLLTLVIFSAFRLLFLIAAWEQIGNGTFNEILEAFANGLRYDNSISGYLLIIPYLLSLFVELIPIKAKWYKSIYLWLMLPIYYFAIFACGADIPYYLYFNTRLTSTVFNWFATPDIVFGFIAESPEYYIYLLVIALGFFGIYKLLRKYINTWQSKQETIISDSQYKLKRIKIAGIFIALGLLQFIAIRGKITTMRPLSWGDAFTTSNPLLNNLGLNPLFSLGNSTFSSQKNKPSSINLIDEPLAIQNVQKYLGITSSQYNSPIARECIFDSTSKHNVVLIVMEGMGNCYLGKSGLYSPSLTPFLDSLTEQSIYFSNFYSDGIHTHNGIWSIFTSMFSAPSEYNYLVEMNMAHSFAGIGTILSNNGYNSMFATSNAAFDNMGAVLNMNGFKEIISTGELLNKEAGFVWGSSDHIIFNSTFQNIDKLYKARKPFIASYLTISNHGPYQIPNPLPQGFHPKHKDPMLRAAEYADWSLKYFFDYAKQQPWFENTIFVLVSDHGKNYGSNYEINYFYKSIPLVFYAPKIITQAQNITKLGCQADLFPTLMNFLGINYVNNTMGVNLFRETRKYVPHSQHSTVSTISDSMMLIRREDGTNQLFKYRNLDLTDYSAQYPQIAKDMEEYVLSNLQASMSLIKNRKINFIPIRKK